MTVKTHIYLAKYRQLKKNNKLNPDSEYHIITRAYYRSVLSPSSKLLKSFKKGMSWEEYTEKFIKEITNNPVAMQKIEKLRKLATKKTIHLICYERDPAKCHRSIVKKMIDGYQTKNQTLDEYNVK